MSKILRNNRREHIMNLEVLYRAGKHWNVYPENAFHQLGHTQRMEDGSLLKQLLYGEMATGQRVSRGPKLRYKDVEENPDVL